MVKAKTTVVVKRVTCNEALQSSRLRAAFPPRKILGTKIFLKGRGIWAVLVLESDPS
jgi:hypothetical protein